jgi:hypothetical protein
MEEDAVSSLQAHSLSLRLELVGVLEGGGDL